MKEQFINLRNLFIGLMIFFFISYPISLTCKIFCVINESNKYIVVSILDFISSTLIVLFLILVFWKILKEEFKKFQERFGNNKLLDFIEVVITGFFLFLAVKFAATIIVGALSSLVGIKETTVENQNIIELLLANAPILMIISTCIYAPISEEILFRGAIRQVIKDKRVFIIVSGLCFGLMHVTGNHFLILELLLLALTIDCILNNEKVKNKVRLSVIALSVILISFAFIYFFQYGNLITKIIGLNLVEVIGSITYILMGMFLATLYVKKDNLYINIAVHALNNILSIVILLFLK